MRVCLIREQGGSCKKKGLNPSLAADLNSDGQRQNIKLEPADQSQKEACKYLDSASRPVSKLRKKSGEKGLVTRVP